LQPGQKLPDQIHADTGTFALQVGYTDGRDLTFNCRQDSRGLFAALRFEMADTLLKLLARLREDEEQEIQCRPRVVFAFVPAGGALLKATT
jgi:hypothetical protein